MNGTQLLLTSILMALLLAGSARDADILLSSGELINGRIAERHPERLIVEHAILGRLTVPLPAVRAIDGKAVAPGEAAAKRREPGTPVEQSDEPSQDAIESIAKPETAKAAEWGSRIELGANLRHRSSEDLTGQFAAQTVRTDARGRFKTDAA
jgi:hypothetical protein